MINYIGQNHRKQMLMKSTVKTLGLVLAAIVSLGAWRSAEAQAIKTSYEGVSSFVGFGDDGQTWVSDGILHIRNAQQFFYDDASDPRISGDVTLTSVNVNYHAVQDPPLFPGYGPMWGTERIQNAGGTWEGTWTGIRTSEGYSYVHVVLKGEGGYAGLYARVDYVRMTPNIIAPFDIAGTITELPAL